MFHAKTNIVKILLNHIRELMTDSYTNIEQFSLALYNLKDWGDYEVSPWISGDSLARLKGRHSKSFTESAFATLVCFFCKIPFSACEMMASAGHFFSGCSFSTCFCVDFFVSHKARSIKHNAWVQPWLFQTNRPIPSVQLANRTHDWPSRHRQILSYKSGLGLGQNWWRKNFEKRDSRPVDS